MSTINTVRSRQTIKDRETQLRRAYHNIIPGTIRKEKAGVYKDKLTVKINCRDCDGTRRVATSDLFQVKLCDYCTREKKLDNRRAKKRRRRATARAAAGN